MSGIMMSSIAAYKSGPITYPSMILVTSASYVQATVPAVGTSPATYECYAYITSTPGNAVLLNSRLNGGSSGAGGGMIVYLSGSIYRLIGNNVGLNDGSVTLNAWNHIAVTMPSGSLGSLMTLWINGVSQGTVALDIDQTSTTFYVGGVIFGGILGYVNNVRYVRGVQVYTGTFTPPTRPLTDTQSAGTNISAITAGQTQLLLNTASAGTLLTDSSSYARTVTSSGTVIFGSI